VYCLQKGWFRKLSDQSEVVLHCSVAIYINYWGPALYLHRHTEGAVAKASKAWFVYGTVTISSVEYHSLLLAPLPVSKSMGARGLQPPFRCSRGGEYYRHPLFTPLLVTRLEILLLLFYLPGRQCHCFYCHGHLLGLMITAKRSFFKPPTPVILVLCTLYILRTLHFVFWGAGLVTWPHPAPTHKISFLCHWHHFNLLILPQQDGIPPVSSVWIRVL